VLIEAHAIAECQEHGHMRDHSDPHAWDHARDVARTDPFLGSSPDEAVAAIDDIMNGIGDTCPECNDSFRLSFLELRARSPIESR
jgi:hypothetical protein